VAESLDRKYDSEPATDQKYFYFKRNLQCLKNLNQSLKGIVSRDFEVCFLVPLDSSDIATSERISAQGVTAAHFVAPVRERQRNGVQI
jgi:hypothetical protein